MRPVSLHISVSYQLPLPLYIESTLVESFGEHLLYSTVGNKGGGDLSADMFSISGGLCECSLSLPEPETERAIRDVSV
jgi:hypothetical protein